MRVDPTALQYWFPKVQAAGLPVPKTLIVKAPAGIDACLDGKEPEGWGPFLAELTAAGTEVGYPCFLRTSYGSGKHDWKNTCYVKDAVSMGQHVYNLIEWSAMVDIMGLPTDTWVIREMLPVKPVAFLPNYGDMPFVREVRGFVRGRHLVCKHPYWPKGAIRQGFRQEPDNLEEIVSSVSKLSTGEGKIVSGLLRAVGNAVPGEWSVDLLETDRGWCLTDMAEARRSFHWTGCTKARLLSQEAHP